ncbi:hypothetical protein LSTR_LSTR003119 [Laodelphax striatellus]|uniref:Cilia- and flagella-associated protein 126 n=1 Tax=Laodelphax striatellus TaxID=195883 RepID=A0A482WW59_LAOST|nr:hypothetical protein LSTR_LSTR003119 [Laodelphax striatellus]
MAYNFSANQFEGSFKPKKLGNWEVAKWFPERPRAHRTATKIIADDRGHLLPGVQRAPASPWGEFRGTWQLPKKISRKTAEELNKPFTKARQSWVKRSSHVPIITPEPSPECPEEKDNGRLPSVVHDNTVTNYNNKEDDKDSGVDVSNEPSSPVRELEEKSRRSCYEKYVDDDYSKTTACDKTPANIDTSSKVRSDVEEFVRTCKTPKELGEKVEEEDDMPQQNVEGTRRKKGPPLAQSYCNPQIAKNLAVENLKHHPLPDTVEDAIYRSLQMKKDRHPGKELDVLPRAAAVGCKSYGTPGPTQCSKLKVYRPKTAGVLPRKDLGQNLELLTRPKTSSGFDQQTRKDKKLSQMQLALCWDLKPVHPGDEPKRSPHIDGSNGSAAPAVFALVQPPQDELPPGSPHSPTNDGRKSKKCLSKPRDAWGTTSPPAIERDIHRGRYGVTNPSAVMDIINTNTTQSGNVVGPRDRSTANLHEHRNGSGRRYNDGGHNDCNNVDKNSNNGRKGSGSKKDSHNSSMSSGFDSVKLSRRKHCHSSPNLTNVGVNENDNNVHNDMNNNDNGCGRSGRGKLLNNRPCMACDLSCSANCHKSSKPEYKMAFKAGKPDNNSNKQNNGSIKNNGSNASGHSLSSLRSNGYQAPKPKVPYAKRSYSIGTLAPPFSLWPGTTGQDYPEHWRLASVYQHSYKPMGSRRKTFLQSVYQ